MQSGRLKYNLANLCSENYRPQVKLFIFSHKAHLSIEYNVAPLEWTKPCELLFKLLFCCIKTESEDTKTLGGCNISTL